MPQIAQQDYIRIEIADIGSLTDKEKAEIKKHIDNGTIWDCIITWISDGIYYYSSKVCGVYQGDGTIFIGLVNAFDEDVRQVVI